MLQDLRMKTVARKDRSLKISEIAQDVSLSDTCLRKQVSEYASVLRDWFLNGLKG
jgi:hypothetical protein